MSFWKDLCIPDMDCDGDVDFIDAIIVEDLILGSEEDCEQED